MTKYAGDINFTYVLDLHYNTTVSWVYLQNTDVNAVDGCHHWFPND